MENDKQRYFLLKITGYKKDGSVLFVASHSITNTKGRFFSKKSLFENLKRNCKELDNIILDFVFEFKNKEDFECHFE